MRLKEEVNAHNRTIGTSTDEEIDGTRSYTVEEKLDDSKFNAEFVKKHDDGTTFTYAHVQRNGFFNPMLFVKPDGLHLKVPSNTLTVEQIRSSVGSRRVVDVMESNTQQTVSMTMKEFHHYWEKGDRSKLYNVISLEFSLTKLEANVKAPLIVRQMDWTDRMWPKHVKLMQTEPTNIMSKMMYPKVQKYVLMSVKGCYTDFHIDFGGTSVWYHVLSGKKVFWLIPPTMENLAEYEAWTLSGKQNEEFFGNRVPKCQVITVEAGNTFFIPSGWIHAVYTPEDSIVFGGNFLHSFNIMKQLQIANVEDTIRVKQKYRFPFFCEMLWYVLARYVEITLGKSHICGQAAIKYVARQVDRAENKENEDESRVTSSDDSDRPHLTGMEYHGLRSIVVYLHRMPRYSKNIPDIIKDPVELIKDVQVMLSRHANDNPEKAITGCPLAMWPDEYSSEEAQKAGRKPIHFSDVTGARSRDGFSEEADFVDDEETDEDERKPRKSSNRKSTGFKTKEAKTVNTVRAAKDGKNLKRAQRCRVCGPCTRNDCGECAYCLDMPKFGGSGKLRQTCLMRRCINKTKFSQKSVPLGGASLEEGSKVPSKPAQSSATPKVGPDQAASSVVSPAPRKSALKKSDSGDGVSASSHSSSVSSPEPTNEEVSSSTPVPTPPNPKLVAHIQQQGPSQGRGQQQKPTSSGFVRSQQDQDDDGEEKNVEGEDDDDFVDDDSDTEYTPGTKPPPKKKNREAGQEEGKPPRKSSSKKNSALKTKEAKTANTVRAAKVKTMRRRRQRCKVCEPCTRDDCGECSHCKDMPKFGGGGKMRQTCKSRQCINPLLAHIVVCEVCKKTNSDLHLTMDGVESIHECSRCYGLMHPACAKKKYPGKKAIISDAMKTLWLCPVCVEKGTGENVYDPRIRKVEGMKQRLSSGPLPLGSTRKRKGRPRKSDNLDGNSSQEERNVSSKSVKPGVGPRAGPGRPSTSSAGPPLRKKARKGSNGGGASHSPSPSLRESAQTVAAFVAVPPPSDPEPVAQVQQQRPGRGRGQQQKPTSSGYTRKDPRVISLTDDEDEDDDDDDSSVDDAEYTPRPKPAPPKKKSFAMQPSSDDEDVFGLRKSQRTAPTPRRSAGRPSRK